MALVYKHVTGFNFVNTNFASGLLKIAIHSFRDVIYSTIFCLRQKVEIKWLNYRNVNKFALLKH